MALWESSLWVILASLPPYFSAWLKIDRQRQCEYIIGAIIHPWQIIGWYTPLYFLWGQCHRLCGSGLCACVLICARVCVWARKRRWKERVKTGWLDGLTEAFFLLYYKSIYHSLSPLFFQAITPSHSSSPVTVYGHMWWICYWNIMQSI